MVEVVLGDWLREGRQEPHRRPVERVPHLAPAAEDKDNISL
jgi:hypothetical protein